MSAPSHPSFPPSFSSFPDLEPESSTGSQWRSNSGASKSNVKKAKSRGKSGERQRKRKHVHENYSMQLNEPKTSANSLDIFFSDRKGDAYNIQYGGLDARNVPKYQPFNRGRNIMGLSPALTAIYRTNNGVEVVPKGRHKAVSLTDLRTRSLLAVPPSKRIFKPENGSVYLEDAEYIKIPGGRHHDMNEESYRLITVASDSESPTPSSTTGDKDSEDEIHLTSHQETLKEIEQHLNEDPSSIEKWFQLLYHTTSTISITSKNASKARSEITISILDRALSADPRNGKSNLLRLHYMKAGEEVWDDGKIRAEWEEALKLGGTEIWMEWLEWKINNDSAGIEEVVESAERALRALGYNEQEELAKVRIFWRVAVAFKTAGYVERATALFQAQAELLYQLPSSFHRLSFEDRLEKLENFWEAEAARLGELDSRGWGAWVASGQKNERSRPSQPSTSNLVELDPYRQWAKRESLMDHTHFLPSRSFDDTDDPYSTILFSDIRPLLVELGSPVAKNAFRCAWLSYLGLHIPGFPDSLSAADHVNWDDRWNHDYLTRRPYLDSLFSQDVIQHRLSTEAYAGVVIGREKEYNSGFGPVKSWGNLVVGPLDGSLERGLSMYRMWGKEDIGDLDEAFVRRIFNQLRTGPADIEWDSLALAFEAAISIKSALKLSRSHLSQKESLSRWAAHAQLEVMRDRLTDARKIYQAVLVGSSPSSSTKEMSNIWWNWAQMEWLTGNPAQSLYVVLRAAGIEGQGGAAVLRCKRKLDDTIRDEPHWKNREGWIKLRALLEHLSGNDISAALAVFDEHIFGERKKTASRESLMVASLLIIYHQRVTLKSPMSLTMARQRIAQGLEEFPSNTIILGLFLEFERGEGVWGRVRGILGESGGRVKDVPRRIAEVWVAGWERGRWTQEIERTRNGLGAAVEHERTRASHVIWRIYLEFEIRVGHLERAKRLLFRAIKACPLVKELYLLAFGPLRSIFSGRELRGIADSMAERGLRLRQGLDEGLEGWKEELAERPESESDSEGDEIVNNARELRRLMPY